MSEKPLSHWKLPRQTIACVHQADDMAYMLHGAQMAAYALQYIDARPSELREMTCLDYGCGTGRISRVLASYFRVVHAYDPQPACMLAAAKECPSIPIPRLRFGLPDEADVAVCVNVLEHLGPAKAKIAMLEMLRIAPMAVVWYDPKLNFDAMLPYLGENLLIEQGSSGKRIHIARVFRP